MSLDNRGLTVEHTQSVHNFFFNMMFIVDYLKLGIRVSVNTFSLW